MDKPAPPPEPPIPSFQLLALEAKGVIADLRSQRAPDAHSAARAAGVDWSLTESRVYAETADFGLIPAPRYRALIREDTGDVVGVVSTAYRPAPHIVVAQVAERLAQQFDSQSGPDKTCPKHSNPEPGVVSAAALGHVGEDALFGVRVRSHGDTTLCILATNTHGGGQAVRFRLVDVDHATGAVLVRGTKPGYLSEPHQGNVAERLEELPHTPRGSGWIRGYLDATAPYDSALKQRRCNRRQREALVDRLWPQSATSIIGGDGALLHHPRQYLLDGPLATADSAWDVFIAICTFIDYLSEAREAGDAIKRRTQRLAYGAGDRIKRTAWAHLVQH